MKNDQFLNVYKNKYFYKLHTKSFPKIIIFDLDETLGSFSLLNVLWRGLNQVRTVALTNDNEQHEFNTLLDLYPEFIRYNILHILEFLYEKKKEGLVEKIYIYTNNNCNPPWVSLISNYFDYKLKSEGTPIFDKAICAFKVNNKPLELSRTTYDKTYTDFIKCTMLPKSTEICFIDNTYHKNMMSEKVYYIQPLAYYHHLQPTTVLQRFYLSDKGKSFTHIFDKIESLYEYLNDWFLSNRVSFQAFTDSSNNVTDIFVSQKLMYHLRDFIYSNLRKKRTRKKMIRLGKMSRKKQNIV
uniref:Uncharacterized protein n=1 Tax=viral metagenome TaxID=1070528 RepID=A0A6C0DPA3_9ZZZZ